MTEIQKARIFEGKKFLWDGQGYGSEEEATATEKDYLEQGFEVRRLAAGEKVLLYTRRPVAATEGSSS